MPVIEDEYNSKGAGSGWQGQREINIREGVKTWKY